MCQDCTDYDDDLGYDDQDDNWGDDGYEGYPAEEDWDGDRDDLDDDYDEMRGYWPEPPDPWDYNPSLLERFRWWLKEQRRRVRAWRHKAGEPFSDEPPF